MLLVVSCIQVHTFQLGSRDRIVTEKNIGFCIFKVAHHGSIILLSCVRVNYLELLLCSKTELLLVRIYSKDTPIAIAN